MHMCFDDLFRINSYCNSMKIDEKSIEIARAENLRMLLQRLFLPFVLVLVDRQPRKVNQQQN